MQHRDVPWQPKKQRSLRSLRRGRGYLGLILWVGLAMVLVLGAFIWYRASQVAELDEPDVGVATIENGKFLGVIIHDETHDQFTSNAWFRLAMNAGHRAASPSRRFQIAKILVRDGQHPDTGEPAVMVLLTPNFQEYPTPPFVPVAVRRWKPPADKYYSQESLAVQQRRWTPNVDDLRQLEEVWSGRPVAEVRSLVTGLNRLLVITVMAVGLILAAGAYRSVQALSSKWDSSLVEQQRSRGALVQLRQLKASRQSREGVDGGA